MPPGVTAASPIFGFTPSDLDADGAAALVLDRPPGTADGVGVVVTPNIQHVALMRRDPAFAAIVRGADLILCDGFPVQLYARARGHGTRERVTGREVVDRILADPRHLNGHRVAALVDRAEVAEAFHGWAVRHGVAAGTRAIVAPPGFADDAAAQDAFLATLRDFGATITLLCLGAPTSERFAHRRRADLPPGWVLCVGQSLKIVLGLVPPPPAVLVRLRLEWAWRIALEPGRMLRRYGPAAYGFVAAVIADRPR